MEDMVWDLHDGDIQIAGSSKTGALDSDGVQPRVPRDRKFIGDFHFFDIVNFKIEFFLFKVLSNIYV